ncbi:MAG: ribonuclease P protein component [Ruminococcaceae bacterium]|nr:ribonuclease P protein component [Oscillospiraceae bacterium]
MKQTISLKNNERFLQVYKKGKRAYHKNFILYSLPNNLDCNRLGIKTGKKLAGAVQRNRIRRLVKESYRLLEADIKVGFDFIFVAKDGALTADSLEETMKAMKHLLKSARLFQPAEQTATKETKTEQPR